MLNIGISDSIVTARDIIYTTLNIGNTTILETIPTIDTLSNTFADTGNMTKFTAMLILSVLAMAFGNLI